jgi:riboflavin kinase/FMN adenylyltransferase
MTGKEFAVCLRKRRISYLAVGVNFRCGYRLDTGAHLMREMMAEGGTFTELVSQFRLGGAPVSSSRIRESILAGDIAGAAELLGRPYSLDLSGLCPGEEKGFFSWDLGSEGRVLPPAGLYRVCIRLGTVEFPAELFLDSARLVLKRDALPDISGDFLNRSALSVEFRPPDKGV